MPMLDKDTAKRLEQIETTLRNIYDDNNLWRFARDAQKHSYHFNKMLRRK